MLSPLDLAFEALRARAAANTGAMSVCARRPASFETCDICGDRGLERLAVETGIICSECLRREIAAALAA